MWSLWVASVDWLQWWPPPPLPRLQMTHMSAFAKVDGGGYQENRSERSVRRIRGDVTGATIEAGQARPSKQPAAQTLPAALFSTGCCTNHHQPLLRGNLLEVKRFSPKQILPQSESKCIWRQLFQHCSLMEGFFESILGIL